MRRYSGSARLPGNPGKRIGKHGPPDFSGESGAENRRCFRREHQLEKRLQNGDFELLIRVTAFSRMNGFKHAAEDAPGAFKDEVS